ncbi:MAG: hypothetical protein J5J04_14555 [Anaerolineae bacterium]|nr:hypothetical protein [Anaerolineae bacterium]
MALLGIDGGGSHVRVVVTDAQMNVLAQTTGDNVNPSSIGREESGARVRAAVWQAISDANLTPGDITAAAAGIAGAADDHSADWVRDMLQIVLPTARIVPSSDFEIALVGAVGERKGVIVIAGTGSAAFGVSVDGRKLRQGGFGYLLGDEGSGYWMGREVLAHALRELDGRAGKSQITPRVLKEIGAATAGDIIAWTYRQGAQVRAIAALAPLLIQISEEGDRVAQGYVARAASELANLVRSIQARLDLKDGPIAFAGGLLETDNRLVEVLMRRLHIEERPRPLYPPAIGAAMLAAQAF